MTDTMQELERLRDSTRRWLELLTTVTMAETVAEADLDPAVSEEQGWEPDFGLVDIINNDVLEAYIVEHRFGGGHVEPVEVVLVTGTGGPHTEVGIAENGAATFRGYWGGETLEVYVGTFEPVAVDLFYMMAPA